MFVTVTLGRSACLPLAMPHNSSLIVRKGDTWKVRTQEQAKKAA